MSEKSAKVDPSQIVDCWSDDERMNFLFSAFPPTRSVNPHHWDTKMSFWRNLITEMSVRSHHGYVSWNNLFTHLMRNGKQPLGLHTVFNELRDSGELVPTMQYMQDMKADETWVGWGLKWVVKKPVGWMADKVLSPIKSSPLKDMKRGQFVLVPALERKCKTLVSRSRDYVSNNKSNDYEFLNILSYSTLQNIAEDILNDTEGLDLVLATLRKNRIIEIWSPDESTSNGETNSNPLAEKFIKFAKDSETKPTPFSEADIGIIKLCETKSHLNDVITKTYQEIDECMQKARACLKNNQRTMAKNALRKKKRFEASLEKKEQSLNNVEQLLESLHQCQTDKMLMDTYKAAVTAYKDASSGLTAEDVQNTMDDVANVLDTQADISEALSGSFQVPDEADNALELEEEFAALVGSQAEENTITDLAAKMNSFQINGESPNLPDVPSHSVKVDRSKVVETNSKIPDVTPLVF